MQRDFDFLIAICALGFVISGAIAAVLIAQEVTEGQQTQCVSACVDGLRVCTAPLSSESDCRTSYDRCVERCKP